MLRSESESDTGRRGREAEESGRDVDQVGSKGEDLGFGRVDIPDRDLEKNDKPVNHWVILVKLLILTSQTEDEKAQTEQEESAKTG